MAATHPSPPPDPRREARQHFDAWAPRYDASPLQAWFGFLHREVAPRVRLPPVGGVILDVGCGTGRALVTTRQWHPGAATVGVDVSPGMLREARRNGLPRLAAGDAAALPVRDEAVDVVLSAVSFHHFPDPEGAAREIHRVLRPGGEVHVVDGSAARPLVRAVEYAVHRVPFRGRRVHRAWQVRRALRDAGFTRVRSHWLGPFARHTVGVKPARPE